MITKDSSDRGSFMNKCNEKFGRGMGGIMRKCRLEKGHLNRHTDMPFLIDLKKNHQKVAEKIERDSLNTRGAPWGVNKDGEQCRRNRQPHWTLKEGDQLYPKHYADYETCIKVAERLTYYVYCMEEAPDCPENIAKYFERRPVKNTYRCPICLLPIKFEDFELARQSKAVIETAHLDPQEIFIHTPENVCFAHRTCNIAQGEKNVKDFMKWIDGILERYEIKCKE